VTIYSQEKADIETVVEWLEGTDETAFDHYAGFIEEAILDLKELATPKTRRDKNPSRSAELPTVLPGTTEINTALPHLRAMLNAMRRYERAISLEEGRAALACLV